ncbi:MAG: hypothetical protein HQM00_05585 [Magnetococcales bacterium]|nr:hypothetical protein [Magnetococcales bacterium]
MNSMHNNRDVKKFEFIINLHVAWEIKLRRDQWVDRMQEVGKRNATLTSLMTDQALTTGRVR